ncbi:hypothetical protein DLAC_06886 [Tieghemostelium lacteum]|uniref:Bud22 domain-containing protein n=1 Tax=Tieghemostelium lacteum TaxID=361077 RepID=A0A151ZDN7_TIELA|nr:hypothetical protein DLAC_06886 [Tieghemostelium lacteum]|eukprot:KYQ92051.1 hypothetical protein DLAC_06886 [Tieghemostelium lacteum]
MYRKNTLKNNSASITEEEWESYDEEDQVLNLSDDSSDSEFSVGGSEQSDDEEGCFYIERKDYSEELSDLLNVYNETKMKGGSNEEEDDDNEEEEEDDDEEDVNETPKKKSKKNNNEKTTTKTNSIKSKVDKKEKSNVDNSNENSKVEKKSSKKKNKKGAVPLEQMNESQKIDKFKQIIKSQSNNKKNVDAKLKQNEETKKRKLESIFLDSLDSSVVEKKKKKQRPGQRQRRLLADKIFGENANYKKAENNNNNKKGKQVDLHDKDLHPSWKAKVANREKMQINSKASKEDIVVFENSDSD